MKKKKKQFNLSGYDRSLLQPNKLRFFFPSSQSFKFGPDCLFIATTVANFLLYWMLRRSKNTIIMNDYILAQRKTELMKFSIACRQALLQSNNAARSNSFFKILAISPTAPRQLSPHCLSPKTVSDLWHQPSFSLPQTIYRAPLRKQKHKDLFH